VSVSNRRLLNLSRRSIGILKIDRSMGKHTCNHQSGARIFRILVLLLFSASLVLNSLNFLAFLKQLNFLKSFLGGTIGEERKMNETAQSLKKNANYHAPGKIHSSSNSTNSLIK